MNNASVNSTGAQAPPGYCRAFTSLVIRGGTFSNLGHLQILHCPGAGHSPTPGLEVLVRILALLQKKTLIGTKSRTLKCLKWHYSTVRSMKNVAALTEDGAFAPFFRLYSGGFDSSIVPTTGNLPSKAKKLLMPGGQPGGCWAQVELTGALIPETKSTGLFNNIN